MSTMTASWLADVLGVEELSEGSTHTIRGQDVVVRDGIPRVGQDVSADQAATRDMFGFKWTQEDTFTRPESLELMRGWLEQRYGRVADLPWWGEYGERPLVVDAGCGAGVSGRELFGPMGDRIRYLGVDLTPAVEVAQRRFHEAGLNDAAFLQADLTDLPLAPGSVDVILSEGVLHHTDSTEGALKALAPLLREGGRILFYVYRRKALIREYTDDAIREQLQAMSPQEAWTALEPLTRLGIALGELDVQLDIPQDVDVLGMKAGTFDLQRWFYYDIAKAYYDPAMTFGEMHHINFDWYAPKNAFRQTEEEVRQWCEEAGLDVESEHIHPSGITIAARKR
jgi:SAM-dependent methyltransferase